MTFEEQLELVSQVLADRSVPARPGPRKQRLRELGLPADADIQTLINTWRYRATMARYRRGQPKACYSR